MTDDRICNCYNNDGMGSFETIELGRFEHSLDELH